jgi:hypothetical protein
MKSSEASRYPLFWPTGWKRTPVPVRRRANFGTKRPNDYKREMTMATATARLMTELRRLGVLDGDAILSTNLKVRLDGLPYSGQAQPADPGVACYFRLADKDRVLACDTWTRVEDNVTAIAAHIEALRAIERYGVGSLEQAFAGYVGLPAKGQTWRSTLGFSPDAEVTKDAIEQAFRARAREVHPDVEGGSHDAMASLTAAKREALESVHG